MPRGEAIRYARRELKKQVGLQSERAAAIEAQGAPVEDAIELPCV